MQNNWHRWYISCLGAWASEDPIGFAGGDGNIRRYAANSPSNMTDPSGLVTTDELDAIVQQLGSNDFQTRENATEALINAIATLADYRAVERYLSTEVANGNISDLEVKSRIEDALTGSIITLCKKKVFVSQIELSEKSRITPLILLTDDLATEKARLERALRNHILPSLNSALTRNDQRMKAFTPRLPVPYETITAITSNFEGFIIKTRPVPTLLNPEVPEIHAVFILQLTGPGRGDLIIRFTANGVTQEFVHSL